MMPVVLLGLLVITGPCSARKLQAVTIAAPIDVDETLLPNIPAVNTTCGNDTLTQFHDCCNSSDAMSAARLSGTLPNDFVPAKRFTALSNNPALCGTVTRLHPDMSTRSNVTPDYINLYNSNVQLDLAALSAENFWVGPVTAAGLGAGTLAYNNLRGLPTPQQAYHTCLFLAEGSLTVLRPNYCSFNKDRGCYCRTLPGLKVFTLFRSQGDWDACHEHVLQLAFDSPHQLNLSAVQYNLHAASVEVSFACREAGHEVRVKVALITLCIVLVVAIIIGVAACCVECRSRKNPCCSCFSARAKAALHMFGFLLVHVYDIITDWVYIFAVARAGNAKVVLVLGWLMMFAPCLVFLGLVGWFVASVCKRKGKRIVFLLMFVIAGMAVLLAFLGVGTLNLARYATGGVVSASDCETMAVLFAVGAISVHGLLLLFFFVGKAAVLSRDDDDDGKSMEVVTALRVMADITFLFTEDIPQFVAQTLFFIQGVSMVSTFTYVMSAAGSVLGSGWGLTHVSLGCVEMCR